MLKSGGELTVGPSADSPVSVRVASARRRSNDARARAEPAARLQPRSGLADCHRPGHPDRAWLLREALDEPPHEGHALIDPHERTPRHRLSAVLGRQHDEELLVLGPNRVEQLFVGVRAGLPVGEDRRRRTEVRARVELGWKERAGRLRLGAKLDDQKVARVVPRRLRNKGRATRKRLRQRVSAQLLLCPGLGFHQFLSVLRRAVPTSWIQYPR